MGCLPSKEEKTSAPAPPKAAKREGQYGGPIPQNKPSAIIAFLVRFLESEDSYMKTVGIFRVPGPGEHVDELKKMLDKAVVEEGIWPSLNPQLPNEVAAVATLLKMYLREAPGGSLLGREDAKRLRATQSEMDQKLREDAVIEVAASLPKGVGKSLVLVLHLLGKVAAFSDENKMTIDNLALVFGVGFADNPDASPVELLKESSLIQQAARDLIVNRERIGEKFVENTGTRV